MSLNVISHVCVCHCLVGSDLGHFLPLPLLLYLFILFLFVGVCVCGGGGGGVVALPDLRKTMYINITIIPI